MSSTLVQSVGKQEKPPHTLLAIDPGKDTGWCLFRDGKIRDFGICRGLEEFIHYMENLTGIDQIVMEEFRLFKHLALQQSGSRMEVTQAEGVAKAWALRHKVPIALQPAQDPLKMGALWSGVIMPKNHKNSHGISALYHGVYWLVKNNMWEWED